MAFRSKKAIYDFGVFSASLKLKIRIWRKQRTDRFCCKASIFKKIIIEKSRSRFSQLNSAAQSDLIIVKKLNWWGDLRSCHKCVNQCQEKDLSIYSNLEALRDGSLYEFLESADLFGKIDAVLIGFTESKNFQSSEVTFLLRQEAKIKIFVENLESGENCLPLPIGFRDGFEIMPPNFPMTEKFYPLDSITKDKRSDNMVFASFSSWTHPTRQKLETIVSKMPNKFYQIRRGKETPFKLPTGDILPAEYLSEMSRFQFALCPRGLGLDTHRFYEALSMNVTPVVQMSRTRFDLIYEVFPCVRLESWEQLQEKPNSTVAAIQESIEASDFNGVSRFEHQYVLKKILEKSQAK